MDKNVSARIDGAGEGDVFSDTCGVWKRDESAAETVTRIRDEVNKSMLRHQR
jgi:hypothetical protein